MQYAHWDTRCPAALPSHMQYHVQYFFLYAIPCNTCTIVLYAIPCHAISNHAIPGTLGHPLLFLFTMHHHPIMEFTCNTLMGYHMQYPIHHAIPLCNGIPNAAPPYTISYNNAYNTILS